MVAGSQGGVLFCRRRREPFVTTNSIQKSIFQYKMVFKSQFKQENGSKNEQTAPRTNMEYPTQEPGVACARQFLAPPPVAGAPAVNSLYLGGLSESTSKA
jgi:hypothetical protein